MNAEQALSALGSYLDGDEALRKKTLTIANNALETVRVQFAEYKRANRALVVENEALKAQLDAVPVKAIDFYFFHVDEEVAMIDADIPGNPEAMINAAVQIGDWLNSTRR